LQQLAGTLDPYTQTKQAHWNVKGSDFIQLHELFDDLAVGVFEYL
jgi:starvation-inducible DNA-binding protein